MPCPGFFTKKVDIIQSLNLYVLEEPPPEWLWLEHDFMSLTLKQMKIIYKEFNSHMTTLCDEDKMDLEDCYIIKKEEENIKNKIKIQFMKKSKKKLNLNFFKFLL